VHLQGCVVKIFGLVASIGPGHKLPLANLCNVDRPGKPANSAACVEVWSGTTLLIDSTNGHKGEVNADTGQSGGINGRSWIDLLANLAIAIQGNPTAPAAGNNDTNPAFAVHANQFLGGHGGDITVISTSSTVTMFGRALQANSSTNAQGSGGGTGGHLVILAHDAVAFGTGAVPAFVQAAGDPNGAGGTILAQSFNGNVTGVAASVLNADGPGGTVTLRGCADPIGTYLGTVIATTYIHTPVCPGGSPSLPSPANVKIPAADCATKCGLPPSGNKTGVKYRDLNQNGVQDGLEPGLIGWTIYVFDTASKALLQTTVTVAANAGPPATPDGFYTFAPPLPPGNYTVCEALPTGWTQVPRSVPPPLGETVANCAPYAAFNALTLGPDGYNFTIVANEVHSNNDFGNFMPGVCPEDPLRAAKITRVVDETGTAHGPAPVYLTVQDAYNAAGAGEVIGLFSKTTENVVLDGAKALTITQCTNARVFALDQAKPVWTISSSKPLLIIGPDAVGGNVGWLINTGGHDLKGLRASGASLYGIQVVGPNNKVAWNSVSGNGGAVNSAGIRVESSGNNLRGGTVSGNTGDGVQIVGGTNILQGATVQSNTGNGVFISGTGNTIKGNKANKNGGAGFLTTAAATGNKFQSNASNASSSGGSKENAGPEYSFGAPETNLGSNKADNVSIPTAAKCPTLFSAGGDCE
jgi:parallel beta-helix repeat protein